MLKICFGLVVAIFVLPDARDLSESFWCAVVLCVFRGGLSSGTAAPGLVLSLSSSGRRTELVLLADFVLPVRSVFLRYRSSCS
jgi:hypothetical protein